MAMLVQNTNGHIQTHLTRSLERILEEANQSGELKLSNRKLKDFPKTDDKYCLRDTVSADLSKNRFSELPEEITHFPFLERLHCYHNAIRFIPDSVSGLQCLSFLDLSRNQLTVLPRELCLLPIKILLVSNNCLTSLPDELNRMSQLTELDASCNQLTHLPPHLNDLNELQSLILRNNLLLAIPIEITLLNLVKLDLRANRIDILPIEIRDMVNLIDLSIDDNPLTSPPASLCKRGRVHIFKYLENEAIKLDRKMGGLTTGNGTLGRKQAIRRNNGNGSPFLAERFKQNKRQNVDSGYSTSSDGYDKRWSQEMTIGDTEKQWIPPATIIPKSTDISSNISNYLDNDNSDSKLKNSVHLSPCADLVSVCCNTNEMKEKTKPLHQIQTYREYKEALKQQRAHEIPSIYRTREPITDEHSFKTEPNTPTHSTTLQSQHNSLATSKSDPTPLNTILNGTKQMEIKTINNFSNGNNIIETNKNKYNNIYIKPKSPKFDNNDNTNKIKQCNNTKLLLNGNDSIKSVNGMKNLNWNNKDEKMTFTMRREIDKAREETDLINQLRNIIEAKLKMTLPEDLASALTDGVVLCHLANHIKPRSVASIHVPSPAVPKLTMARCRRNVDNFIEACRKIGVDENLMCCAADVLEGRGLVQIAITVTELLRFYSPKSPLHTNSFSSVV